MSAVMERAKMEYHNDPIVKQASSIVSGMKMKRTFQVLWRVVLLIVGIAIYVWGFTTEWKIGGKIAWGFFGLAFPTFCGMPGMFMLMQSDLENNLFDN